MPPLVSPHAVPPLIHAADAGRHARPHRAPACEAWRPVECCPRGGDRFERRNAFEAAPGAVPYWLYLEAQNIAHRLLLGTMRAALTSARRGAEAAPAEASPCEPSGADPRRDAPRLGDVAPVRPEAEAGAPEIRRVVTTREAATGRIFDAVF